MLHVLQQAEQFIAAAGKAGEEGAVLDRAMQLLQPAQQPQQLLGIVLEGLGQLLQGRHLGVQIITGYWLWLALGIARIAAVHAPLSHTGC